MTLERLLERERNGDPIRVAVVGAGHMGGGTAYQISKMKGMRVAVLAERDIRKAINVYVKNGIPEDRVRIANNPGDAQDAVLKGEPVVTENSDIIVEMDGVDAVVEATGVPEVGARIAYRAIMAGKHTVMLNIEADVVVGPMLSRLARRAGVIYSIAAGDQPGAICELYEWATCIGLEVVCAGRGTWLRPNGRYLTPDDFIDLEKKMGGSAQMYCSFHDGTKPQIEMAVTANVLGMAPDIRGMHEPFVYVKDLQSVFCLKSEGGILANRGVVDVANCYNAGGEKITEGTVGQGVFLIVTTDHPGIQKNLGHLFRNIKGAGPNFALFRPYHLTCIETPYSVVRACLYGETTGAARDRLAAEVIAVAKKDLRAGEILDGGGGYTVVGMIERAEIATRENLLPLGFAYNIPVLKDIPKDSPIKRSDVEMDTGGFLYKLRALQDEA